MSEQVKKLVPKLRFSEFENLGGWVYLKLGELLIKHPDYGVNAPAVPYSKDLPVYLRITDISEDGYFLNEGRVSVAANVMDENYLEDGDIVLARTGASVGKTYKYRKADGPLVFAGFLIRIKPDPEKINSYYLYNYFSSNQYYSWVTVNSARSGQPGINGNEYASLLIPIPPYENKLAEQQKIADCLSSLDDLITAQYQKVEALKQHKKGLIQQLFPAEGETVPKLRFPEFENDEGWQLIPLNKIAKRCINKNRNEQITRVLTNSAEFGVVDQRDFFDKDIATQGNLDGYYIVEEGDYVYNPRISSFAPVGPISKNKIGLGVMSPLYTVFRFDKVENDFYSLFFKSTGWHHYMRQASSTGARHDRMAISNEAFMDMPIPVTSNAEQQKIADFLSSIDELITIQTQQLEAYKTHKKGLMQQLFPSLNEV
jgi:type I restriction enzyme, S subunit